MNTAGEGMDAEIIPEERVEAPVWVQCEGFRCLAYRDRRGDWRTFARDEKLPRVVRVLNESLDG